MSTLNYGPAVHKLVDLVEARIPEQRPCFILRGPFRCALIVPVLSASYDFMRAFNRATVDCAEHAGLIVLGQRLEDVPPYSYGGKTWQYEPARKGRTIALPQTGGERA